MEKEYEILGIGCGRWWIAMVCFTMLVVSVCLYGCGKEPYVEAGKGLFSVSETRQVVFAMGNLAEDGHGFVAHQWEYGGYFGWGTGDNPGNVSEDAEEYPVFHDWGDNVGSGWRTLTKDEWYYLFTHRPNASARYGSGTVDGVHGMVVLPDVWTQPSNCTFYPGMYGWNNNNYTLEQWTEMEANGAMFLPAAGDRWGTTLINVSQVGRYWSSMPYRDTSAYSIYFNNGFLNAVSNNVRHNGFSVRLVQDKR